MPPSGSLARAPLRQELRPLYLAGRPVPSVVAVAAYFDESQRLEREPGDTRPGLVAVAGYVGTVGTWDDHFSPAWRATIESAPHPIREFKAADCRHGTGEFRPPWTKDERRELTEALVSLVVDAGPARLIGLGAVTLLDFSTVPPDDRAALCRFGYLWSLAMASADAVRFAANMLGEDRLQLVFDEADEPGKALQSFMTMREIVAPALADRIRPPHFGPSHEIEPLQAADLLAYETYKEMENRLTLPLREPSRALTRLVAGPMHMGRYWSFADLRSVSSRRKLGEDADYAARLIYDSIKGDGIVREEVQSW